MQDRDAGDRFEVRGKRIQLELTGWRARLLSGLIVWSFIALVALIPAACAFFVYAEGGTSLPAAVGYSVALPVAGAVWFCASMFKAKREARRRDTHSA